MPRRAAVLAIALAAWLAVPTAIGNVTLTLKDGRKLEGKEVRREDDLYLLELEDGSVMPLPMALIATVGLEDRPPPPLPHPITGLSDADPEVLAGTNVPLTVTGPQVLAGKEVRPPTTAEQLEVLGAPSRFQQDAVVSNMHPTYWVMDPDEHNWAPSKWAKAPIDSSWEPESGLDSKDALEGSRSTFKKSIVDSNWEPTDGFAKSRSW